MPYITQAQRNDFDKFIVPLAREIKEKSVSSSQDGNMNYSITKLIGEVFGIAPSGRQLRYHEWNSIVGFLECAKLELYRKCVAPYEDVKEDENGPVLTYYERNRNN